MIAWRLGTLLMTLKRLHVPVAVLAVAACGGSGSRAGTLLSLRPACATDAYWDAASASCKPRGSGAARIAAGKDALARQDVDQARTALDDAERNGGPLDHAANVTLWEQRGIAAAYLGDHDRALSAFDMLLALDPGHVLSYHLSPQATFVFEDVRGKVAHTGAPTLDVNWPHGQKVGDPVPLDVEVVADPKRFLRRATLFVRARGDAGWRAADLSLGKRDARIILPPVTAARATSLELYLRAYDDRGNEVLAWADPSRPREIPLRYDPPPPWYRKWWVITIGVGAIALGTGGTVYAVTREPPDKIGGSSTVK